MVVRTFRNISFSSLIAFLCISIAMAGKVTDPKKAPKNAILLSKVESLTLRAGKPTTSRRVAAVPQLTCTGPTEICGLYQPEVMRCTNEGSGYGDEDIQWSCKASLPEEFKLGSTEVICEGYASSDDPFVLKGSCGVEYRLLLTQKGEEVYGDRLGGRKGWHDGEGGESSAFAKVLFFVIFGGVLFIIIKGMLDACRRGGPPRLGGGSTGPGQGWNGGDDNDDPPPPYDQPSANFGFSKKSASTRTTAGPSSAARGTRTNQANQGWRPGPWTTGLAGAGLGYLAGRNQGRSDTRTQPAPSTGLFGGGNSRNYGSGPSSSSRASSSPSHSETRYESTGFGSTSRR